MPPVRLLPDHTFSLLILACTNPKPPRLTTFERCARPHARSKAPSSSTPKTSSFSSGAHPTLTLRNAALLLHGLLAPAFAHCARAAWPAAEVCARSARDASTLLRTRHRCASARVHRPTRSAVCAVLRRVRLAQPAQQENNECAALPLPSQAQPPRTHAGACRGERRRRQYFGLSWVLVRYVKCMCA
jgi:hypothetical protein